MTLDLKDSTTWDPIVSKELSSCIGETYVATIRNNAEAIRYRDNANDGCDLFSSLSSKKTLIASISVAMSTHFKEVLTYHSCRPNKTDQYYKKGIFPLQLNDAQQQFRDLLRPYASHEEIEAAIASTSTETREGVVHTVLDDRCFYDGAGHYLIYGGEYQNCLTVRLPGDMESTRDILKKLGRATVFTCRLPFGNIPYLEDLASDMLADHFYRIAHNNDDVTIIDYTIIMADKIPPSAIVGHYHPVRIPDPFKQRAIWNDELMEYES